MLVVLGHCTMAGNAKGAHVIRQFCPGCGSEVSVPDGSVGLSIRWFKCGAALVVSATAPSSSSGAGPAPPRDAAQPLSVPRTTRENRKAGEVAETPSASAQEERDTRLDLIGLPIYMRPLAWALVVLEGIGTRTVALVRALIRPGRVPRYLVDYCLDFLSISGSFWKLFFIRVKDPTNVLHSWLVMSGTGVSLLAFPIVVVALVVTILSGDILGFPRAVTTTVGTYSGGFPYGAYLLALLLFLSLVALRLWAIPSIRRCSADPSRRREVELPLVRLLHTR